MTLIPPTPRISRFLKTFFPTRAFVVAFFFLFALRLAEGFLCGIWFDEAFTLKISSCTPHEIGRRVLLDVHPPYYYFYIHPFIGLLTRLGLYSVGLLRLTSILPVMTAVLGLSRWATRRWGAPAGLRAMLLAGLAPGMLYYSVELRNYAPAMMFVLFSTFALARLIRRYSPGAGLLYFLCAFGYLGMHYLTIVIYGVQLLLHLVLTLARSRRPGAGRRWRGFLLPHLALLALVVVMALAAQRKFTHYYEPANPYLYTAGAWDFAGAFLYDFPVGMVYFQSYGTLYGLLSQGVMALFYLFLASLMFHHRKCGMRNAECGINTSNSIVSGRRPGDRLALRLCFWTLLLFLGSTWAASVLGYGKLYCGFRTAMLVLPLWLMAMMLIFETRLSPPWNARAGRLLVAIMIPCSFFGMLARITILDDFKVLATHAQVRGAIAARLYDSVYYVDDLTMLPWLRRLVPSVHFEPLPRILEPGRFSGRTMYIVTPRASDVRLRDDREAEVINLVRTWVAAHHRHAQRLDGFQILEIPPGEFKEFTQALSATLAALHY